MNRFAFWLGILMLSCVVRTGAAATAPLVWAGCGITKKAFMAELAAEYQRKYGVEVILEGGGATKGIRRISDKTVDMGGTCRPKLFDSTEESTAQLVPVAWDALVVIVHPDNPVKDITLEQIRDIYDGRIANWRELGGPDRRIEVMVRKGKISGVGLTLRELVFADANHEFAATKVFPSTGPLEKAVEQNVAAIGVTGISSARKRNVRMLNLEGKEPNYDTVRSGEYLLYRPLYIAVNPTGERSAEVKRFVDFAHSRAGREIIRNQGSVPYLEALRLVHKQREQRRAARTASNP